MTDASFAGGFAAPQMAHRAWAEAPVRVLEVDPELGARLPESERAAATRASGARTIVVDPGPWPLQGPALTALGMLGLLILDGLLGIELDLEGRRHLELIADGDLTRPWMQLGAEASVATTETAIVLAPTRLAVLDRQWALRMARWPEITSALMNRLVLRARRLGLQHAASSLPRVDDRLLVMLWHLADRWGRMTRDGVLMALPLRHDDLACMIGAQRPSVTTAVGRLEAEGRVARRPGRVWLLRGSPPSLLRELERDAALTLEAPAP